MPTSDELWSQYRAHLTSPGVWPAEFTLVEGGRVQEGPLVLSRSGDIEGRTTGSRRRCLSTGRPGWFIGVSWETGRYGSIAD